MMRKKSQPEMTEFPPPSADMARDGRGGTRLAQTTNETSETSFGIRLTSTLPTAQLKAAASASPRASGFRSPPTVNPMEKKADKGNDQSRALARGG